MTETLESDRTRVNRHDERGHYDTETVFAILDEGLVGHLGFVDGGQPYVLPMLYVRAGDQLYLHGSPRARALGMGGDAARLCLTVTLVDGIVLARSAFKHSINYRSVVVLGEGRLVQDRAEKLESMRLLVDHVMPGRSADARGPSDGEVKATKMVAMTISEASAKARSGPPVDTGKDLALPVWAGVLPVAMVAGQPVADELSDARPVPEYVTRRCGRKLTASNVSSPPPALR